MKRLLLLLAAALFVTIAGSARAQEEVEDLAWLTVELWPEYDRPEMLVLMTGAVPNEASLPAAVTLPVPAGATLNAVARITDDNAMIDDVEFAMAEDTVTLITPDRRFRVEYYAPVQESRGQKSYTFNWQADLTVEEMAVAVQEPEGARSLAVEPPAVEVTTGFDDLSYHNLPPQSVPAGAPYSVTVTYETEGAGVLPDGNWPALLAAGGGLLVLLALAWQLWGERLPRPGRTAQRRRPVREKSGTGAEGQRQRKEPRPAKFCHECGEETQPDDRFCRNCGTRLKGV